MNSNETQPSSAPIETARIDLAPLSGVPSQSLVVIGSGLLGNFEAIVALEKYSTRFILTDQNTYAHWVKPLAERIGASVIQVPSGEQHKVLSSVEYICRCLMQGRADRRSLLINVGGGLVGDLGGFAASVYMRGIDFVQVPTTLLAQVDASVGGKTGVNLESVKNIIGAFQQPLAVVIDVATLSSLPKRELCAGFAEILKHGLITDEGYFNWVVEQWVVEQWQANRESFDWAQCVERSCHIKARIVAIDEKEAGVRKLLNFGHTIGHALEAVSHKSASPLLHGEAVGLGMLAETFLAERAGIAETGTAATIKRALTAVGLPVVLEGEASPDSIMSLIRADKKNVANKVMWSLVTKVGSAVFDQQVDDELVVESILRLQRT
jgi:3-dehydroquinate synthase